MCFPSAYPIKECTDTLESSTQMAFQQVDVHCT